MNGRLFYRFARTVMNMAMRLRYRVKVSGADLIPEEGSFILCGNHIHSLDPVMLAVVIKRPLRFMAKKELFASKFNRFFLSRLGAFPVDRAAADMKSYRKAVEVLEAGEGLLMFSQGRRMKNFDNAKSGAALFALKTGAPIVPAGISGDYRLFSTVYIRFGRPINMDAYAGGRVKSGLVNEVMAEVVTAVKGLT